MFDLKSNMDLDIKQEKWSVIDSDPDHKILITWIHGRNEDSASPEYRFDASDAPTKMQNP